MRNIAVIITVYNRIDKTIACLDAVFSQREKYHFFNVDVYLTDDGSTDDTLKILQPRFLKNHYLFYQVAEICSGMVV